MGYTSTSNSNSKSSGVIGIGWLTRDGAVGAEVSKVYEAVAVEQEEVLVAASAWEA